MLLPRQTVLLPKINQNKHTQSHESSDKRPTCKPIEATLKVPKLKQKFKIDFTQLEIVTTKEKKLLSQCAKNTWLNAGQYMYGDAKKNSKKGQIKEIMKNITSETERGRFPNSSSPFLAFVICASELFK